MWDEPAAWLIDALKVRRPHVKNLAIFGYSQLKFSLSQWFTIASLLYIPLTGCIKLAFLFFFYRIFSPQRTMKYWIIGGIIFVVCLNLGIFFGTLFTCSPIEKYWNSALSGHCIDSIILPYLSGASSSAMDIFILLLPIRPLWALNMSLARKLRVLAVFCVGLL